jgi:alpha-1,6-mannosyltransferase
MTGQIKRKLINVSPLYLSLAVTFAHVLLSPYTKVEESFTLHAVHDVLAYGHHPAEITRVSNTSPYQQSTGVQADGL